jgi:glucokinase
MFEPVYIGIDVGGTNLRAASFIGQTHLPYKKHKEPTQPAESREAVIARLQTLIGHVLPEPGTVPAAIGVTIPGPVDPFRGVVVRATNIPGWDGLPLRELLTERMGAPVLIGNDANLAALGEWKFGAGRGYKDVLFVTVSTGIGGGVVLDDRLLLGQHGLATEVGHIFIEKDGPLCGCGQRGCLEALAAGPAISRRAIERLKAGQGPDSVLRTLNGGALGRLTTHQIGRAAVDGDAFARLQIEEAGDIFGYGLASLLHLFDPGIVVLGGGVSFIGDLWFDRVRANARRYAMNPAYWQDVPIVPAALGDDAGLIGAAALAMSSQ